MSTGCLHGTGWFARSLAAEGVAAASRSSDADLRPALEQALAVIAASHRGSCDLTAPGTPSAAVGLLRQRDDQLDFLVLSDVTIIMECAGGSRTITDDRCSELLGGLP